LSEHVDDSPEERMVTLILLRRRGLFHGGEPLMDPSPAAVRDIEQNLAVSPHVEWRPHLIDEAEVSLTLEAGFECSSPFLHIDAHLVHRAGSLRRWQTRLQADLADIIEAPATWLEALAT